MQAPLPSELPSPGSNKEEAVAAPGETGQQTAFGSTPARLLRVFIDETSRYRGHPLYEALLEMLKTEGCAGATVTRAISGFGGHGMIHNDNLVDVLPQLPLIIEVVDHPAQLEKIRPQLEAMVEEGLIIVHDVDIWKYSYRPRLREVPGKATTGQVMTRATVSVQLDTPLVEVVRLLLDQDYIKSVPVVNAERKVVGIITDGDLLTRGDVPHRLRVLATLDRESLAQLMAELHHNAKTAADVMTSSAITLHPETPVREAARLMVDRKLKRMPVVDREGHLVGMLGRLDVLKLVANSTPARQRASGTPPPHLTRETTTSIGKDSISTPPRIHRVARDVMITDVPTVGPKTPVAEVLERLVSSHLRRLVVVNERRKILGVITDADLVERVSHHSRPGVLAFLTHSLGLRDTRALHPTQSAATAPERRGSARTAEELMITDLVTVGPDEPLEGVVKVMVENKVKFLPVQNAQDQLLGVVLRSDVLRAVTEDLEQS